ncbi:XdhC family protein [Kushneria phosphatilytica]|uniref:XdhC family protein n=1 Tax=Kushneria phosphatilytica TaxID=657387 RepID=A0A1S1NXT0_9GAMM|nr:XdhC family protein [Kushneria phosphatilytica]OHV12176.1 XshC-Cox1 family protein [Kushneria phosphatilytica]QEL11369.1 XdhC family protein [Kushneria phosphatilytica]
MRHLDLRVVSQALAWARAGEPIWLCTVLSTYGSSPRAPGSMLVAKYSGDYVGSLSGGCVEEAFIESLQDGAFQQVASIVRYGESQEESQRLQLPCGGILEVLVERRESSDELITHLEVLEATLLGQKRLVRRVDPDSGRYRVTLDESAGGPAVAREEAGEQAVVLIRIGPALRMILAGISPVAGYCAQFARALGYEVIVCDARDDVRQDFLASGQAEGIEVQSVLPSLFIASGGCHEATAVVALTHDPRIDDLAMIEAVRTPAFYIGVMGSQRTSQRRAERLARSGGLSEAEIARIHMPIGLDLGSKAPAEIALSVVADVMRIYNGRAEPMVDRTRSQVSDVA